MKQCYWPGGVKWIEGPQMRVQSQEEAERGVSYMASFWRETTNGPTNEMKLTRKLMFWRSFQKIGFGSRVQLCLKSLQKINPRVPGPQTPSTTPLRIQKHLLMDLNFGLRIGLKLEDRFSNWNEYISEWDHQNLADILDATLAPVYFFS